MENNFVLDPDRLAALAAEHSPGYKTAHPFPHTVIDNFLPPEILHQILQEFPERQSKTWNQFDAPAERKLAIGKELEMGKATRLLLYQLNSSLMMEFLEALTGITGLVGDPYFVGGGLHQIERGGFLKVHADFNRHDRLRLDRRLNAIIYLNEDWKEEYGGDLELWNRDMTEAAAKILPVFNRLVVFSTTDFSYHGHPDPLQCPPERARRSLAMYYYSSGRPAEELSADHSTLFKERPGEAFQRRRSLKSLLIRFIPPILFDLKNALLKPRRNKE